jgi:hypothetical protein
MGVCLGVCFSDKSAHFCGLSELPKLISYLLLPSYRCISESVNWPVDNKSLLVKYLRVVVEAHSREILHGDTNYYSLYHEL